jgi:hypothetical protein
VFRYYEGSKEGFFKGFEINKKNFGEDHVIFARNLNNLSIILRNLGDYEGAKKGN